MTWQMIGTVTPVFAWRRINADIPNTTLKVSFTAANFGILSSFCRVRASYSGGGVTPSVIVYPSQEDKIIEIPVSEALINRGQTLIAVSVLKVLTGRARRWNSPDPRYELTLESLV